MKLCLAIYFSTQLSINKQHNLQGVPLISHIAHVATILEEFGQSKNTIIASYLRDLYLHDDDEFILKCKKSIDQKIHDILDILSTKTIQEIAKYAKTNTAYRSAALIILADILSNLTFLEYIPEDKVEEVKTCASETLHTLSGIDSRVDDFIWELLE